LQTAEKDMPRMIRVEIVYREALKQAMEPLLQKKYTSLRELLTEVFGEREFVVRPSMILARGDDHSNNAIPPELVIKLDPDDYKNVDRETEEFIIEGVRQMYEAGQHRPKEIYLTFDQLTSSTVRMKL
jgi:hypothetical protein